MVEMGEARDLASLLDRLCGRVLGLPTGMGFVDGGGLEVNGNAVVVCIANVRRAYMTIMGLSLGAIVCSTRAGWI